MDRKAVLTALNAFLDANNLKADWEGIENAPNEALVNALAMMSPYGPAEKQALLEAPDLKNPRRNPGRRHRDRTRQESDRRRDPAAIERAPRDKRESGAYNDFAFVIAGLVPAISLMQALSLLSGLAGPSPATTE